MTILVAFSVGEMIDHFAFSKQSMRDNHHEAPVCQEVLILNSTVPKESNNKQANYTPSSVLLLQKLCISNKTGILGERLSYSLKLNFENTVDFKGKF